MSSGTLNSTHSLANYMQTQQTKSSNTRHLSGQRTNTFITLTTSKWKMALLPSSLDSHNAHTQLTETDA